jgi:hypothetical protein
VAGVWDMIGALVGGGTYEVMRRGGCQGGNEDCKHWAKGILAHCLMARLPKMAVGTNVDRHACPVKRAHGVLDRIGHCLAKVAYQEGVNTRKTRISGSWKLESAG